MKGVVYLVGAGPGDPGLMTVRAVELLERADVVVVDALVSPEILERIKSSAEVIDAGKRAGNHTLSQDEINRILVEKATDGATVVRLKGGDPFVFGRGGEEAAALREAGIRFEVVPGVTSAVAAPAYAGIPVTHRAHATSVTFITGHESDSSTGIAWESLAKSGGTLVFFMGVRRLQDICDKLMEQGLSPDVPVAVISRGTTSRQRTVVGSLSNIASLVSAAAIETPALIVVGDVVRLREQIEWFERRPLFGRTVIVTRAREQASLLKQQLEEQGAEVLQFPTIEIAPPETFESLDSVIRSLEHYQWIIFTSHNGVASFFSRLRQLGLDARSLAGIKVAAVGETTAAELEHRGITPDLVPPRFQSSALLPLLDADQTGIRTAVIRAASGREELIDGLRLRGGTVDLGIAYVTRPSALGFENVLARIKSDTIDCVTFTSASTVENFLGLLGQDERERLVRRAALISIGPTTSEALRGLELEPTRQATEATIESLRDAVLAHFASTGPV